MPLPPANREHVAVIAFLCVTAFVAVFVYARLRTLPIPAVISEQPMPIPIREEKLLPPWAMGTPLQSGTIVSVSGNSIVVRVTPGDQEQTMAMTPATLVFELTMQADYTSQTKQVGPDAVKINRPIHFRPGDNGTVSEIYVIAQFVPK